MGSLDSLSLMWKNLASITISICILFLTTSCAPTELNKKTSASCSKRVSLLYSSAPEPSFCSGPIVHGTPIQISGEAKYQKLAYGAVGLSTSSTELPIRYAEVVAKNSSGTIVQCGQTSGTGTFSLDLPLSSSNYVIEVRSRGNNSAVKASVLNCPEENKPYTISANVVPDVPKNVGTLIASSLPQTDKVAGGAFNIFDNIVKANEFLSSQVDNSCGFFPCPDAFEVLPKISAYWQLGFNPNLYFGSSDPVSFYLPGYSRMFLMGGNFGEYENEDTDHYDDSVILHEYGHFIEDTVTKSDSPGGSHSGNQLIDPRLAWSEAWGNFLQAAIRNTADYLDTEGHPPGTSTFALKIDVENYNSQGSACAVGSNIPGCDRSSEPGEGIFREFTITRMLWDLFDDIPNSFNEIWTILSSEDAFLKPTMAFRNVGQLHELQSSYLIGAADWSPVQTAHFQTDTREYATYVEKDAGGCGGMIHSMDPDDSDLFMLRSVNSYYYIHTGGAVTFRMRYLTANPLPNEPDLDFYIFNEGGELDSMNDLVGASFNDYDDNPNTPEIETITYSNLQAGKYLLVVFGAIEGDNTNYELTVDQGSEVELCPAGLP